MSMAFGQVTNIHSLKTFILLSVKVLNLFNLLDYVHMFH